MLRLGLDGCRGGWIGAALAEGSATPKFHLFIRFADVLRVVGETDAIACIDVPIGLSTAPRRCDLEARRLLGAGRGSSVFTPPCRAALAGTTPDEIRTLNLAVTGRSLPAQTLGILPKVREVDAAMTAALQRRIREVHPEVVFATIRGARTAPPSKKTDLGRRARRALLPAHLRDAVPGRANRPFAAGPVALDDYVDALAALFVAERIARGEAQRLPVGGEERDERGLAMEVWF